MRQVSSVALHTRDLPSPPPSAFYFQLPLWIVVTVDLTFRYCLRWKARSHVRDGVDYATLKLSFEDGFVLLSYLPYTAYTWLLPSIVFDEHSTRFFFASRLPLQYALVCTQLAQSCLYMRFRAARRVRTHVILTSALALLSAVLVTPLPTMEMQTFRAVTIAAATVMDEMYNAVILTRCVCISPGAPPVGQIVAWVLRVISAIITATLGGYYFRTFWPPWSIQVVLFQQLNLFLSMAITRGLGFLSAWKQYKAIRSPRGDSTDFLCTDSQTIESRHDLEHAPTNSQFDDGKRAIRTTTLRPADSERTMTDQMVRTQLERAAADLLSGTKFGPAPGSQSQCDATSDSALECTDEPETSLAREWSAHAGSRPSVTKDGIMIDRLTGIRVIGVERLVDIKQRRQEGSEQKYGYVRIAIDLPNGYQYLSFHPKWVGQQQLPRGVRTELWEVIGSIFWHHTDVTHSARWQEACERYENSSTGVQLHLCAKQECKTCSAVHGQVCGKLGAFGSSSSR